MFSSILTSRLPSRVPDISGNVLELPYRTDKPTFTGDFRRVQIEVRRIYLPCLYLIYLNLSTNVLE